MEDKLGCDGADGVWQIGRSHTGSRDTRPQLERRRKRRRRRRRTEGSGDGGGGGGGAGGGDGGGSGGDPSNSS